MSSLSVVSCPDQKNIISVDLMQCRLIGSGAANCLNVFLMHAVCLCIGIRIHLPNL